MKRIKKSAGFSLVEMMVALAISVVFVGSAATILSRNKTDYIPLRDSSRMNEGAMAVFAMMDQGIGQAGYFGDNQSMSIRDVTCSVGNTRFINHIYNATLASTNLFGLSRRQDMTINADGDCEALPLSTAIEGFEGSAPALGFLPSGVTVFDDQKALMNTDDGILPGTDAITIRGSAPGYSDVLANSITGGNVGVKGGATRLAITIPGGAGSVAVEDGSILPRNGYFVIYDGEDIELFKAVVNGNSVQLVQDPDGNMPGVSLTRSYYSSLAGGGNSENGQSYVAPVNFVRYYISNFENNEGEQIPSLYRESYDASRDGVFRADQLLIEGVEDMQITYAEDLTVDSGGDATFVETVDRYSRADQVENWDKVLAVKISLLMRSESQSSVDATTGTKTYQVNDQQVVPGTNDRYARRVFTAQFTLDNRV